MRAVIARIPTLDILVDNAGTNTPEPSLDVSEERLDFLLGLNVRAMSLVAQAAVRMASPDFADRVLSRIPIGRIGQRNEGPPRQDSDGNFSLERDAV